MDSRVNNQVLVSSLARLPAAVSGNEPALIPEKTAGLVNETLLIPSNQKLACSIWAGKLLIGRNQQCFVHESSRFFGEARGTERAAEIEPTPSTAGLF